MMVCRIPFASTLSQVEQQHELRHPRADVPVRRRLQEEKGVMIPFTQRKNHL
jgi:hypothetical protein